MGDWDGGVLGGRSVAVGPQRRRLPGAAGYSRGHGVLHGRGGIPSAPSRLDASVAAVEIGGVYSVVGRLWSVGGRESIGGKGVQIRRGVRVGVGGAYVVEGVAVLVLVVVWRER